MIWAVGQALDTALGRLLAGITLVLGVLWLVDRRARKQATQAADDRHRQLARRAFDETSTKIREADVSRGDLDSDLLWLRQRAARKR